MVLLVNMSALPVAPLVGAWIEIVKYMLKAVVKESLLSWERGLKFSYSASD